MSASRVLVATWILTPAPRESLSCRHLCHGLRQSLRTAIEGLASGVTPSDDAAATSGLCDEAKTAKLLRRLQQLLLYKASRCLELRGDEEGGAAEAADTMALLASYTRLLVTEACGCLSAAADLCRNSAFALARLTPLLTESTLLGQLLPDFLLSLLVLQDAEQKRMTAGEGHAGPLPLDALRLDAVLQALLPCLDLLSRLSSDAAVADRHEAMLPVRAR